METKFTKGEWFLKNRCGGYRIKDNEQRDVCDIYSFASSISDEEAAANAKLIADAGTTANKCGLMPSELLEQRNDLLEALIDITNSYRKYVNVTEQHLINNALIAIKKATE